MAAHNTRPRPPVLATTDARTAVPLALPPSRPTVPGLVIEERRLADIDHERNPRRDDTDDGDDDPALRRIEQRLQPASEVLPTPQFFDTERIRDAILHPIRRRELIVPDAVVAKWCAALASRMMVVVVVVRAHVLRQGSTQAEAKRASTAVVSTASGAAVAVPPGQRTGCAGHAGRKRTVATAKAIVRMQESGTLGGDAGRRQAAGKDASGGRKGGDGAVERCVHPRRDGRRVRCSPSGVLIVAGRGLMGEFAVKGEHGFRHFFQRVVSGEARSMVEEPFSVVSSREKSRER
nr:hypothetical protein CFP56_53279 [Quercus suber]